MLETFQYLDLSLESVLMALGLAACPYLLFPLAIKATLKIRALPILNIFDPENDHPPQAAVEFFESTTQEMKRAGFSVVNYVLLPNQVSNTVGVVMLFENRVEQDLAIAAIMWGFAKRVDSKTVFVQNKHVEFSTDFDDGSVIGTNNNTEESAFAPVSHKTILQFPDVKRASHLYRLHQRAIEEFAHDKKKKLLPATDQLIEELKRGLIKESHDQIATGILYLDSEQEYYRPTFALLKTAPRCCVAG